MFNFGHLESFQRFEMLTESDDNLDKCFDQCVDVNKAAKKWLKIWNKLIRKYFKNIRIQNDKTNPKLTIYFG